MGMKLCGTIADLAYAQGQISGKQRTEARNGRDRTPTFSGGTKSCLADFRENPLGFRPCKRGHAAHVGRWVVSRLSR